MNWCCDRLCSWRRWCIGIWSPATSSTWTIQETLTLYASVTLALPSNWEETTDCCSHPVTPPTSWLLKWGIICSACSSCPERVLNWSDRLCLLCCRYWCVRVTTLPVIYGVWESCSTPCWRGQWDSQVFVHFCSIIDKVKIHIRGLRNLLSSIQLAFYR